MEKRLEKRETSFKEGWLEDFTYEDTLILNEFTTENSGIDQDLSAQTVHRKAEREIKIRIPRQDDFGKTNSSQILCKWEGVVDRINGDSFWGKLKDLTVDTAYINEAEFSIDDLQEGDKDLLEIGSVFYWYIGYITTFGGTRTKVSLLKFKRLPQWQKNKIKDIDEKVKDLMERLKWT